VDACLVSVIMNTSVDWLLVRCLLLRIRVRSQSPTPVSILVECYRHRAAAQQSGSR